MCDDYGLCIVSVYNICAASMRKNARHIINFKKNNEKEKTKKQKTNYLYKSVRRVRESPVKG